MRFCLRIRGTINVNICLSGVVQNEGSSCFVQVKQCVMSYCQKVASFLSFPEDWRDERSSMFVLWSLAYQEMCGCKWYFRPKGLSLETFNIAAYAISFNLYVNLWKEWQVVKYARIFGYMNRVTYKSCCQRMETDDKDWKYVPCIDFLYKMFLTSTSAIFIFRKTV